MLHRDSWTNIVIRYGVPKRTLARYLKKLKSYLVEKDIDIYDSPEKVSINKPRLRIIINSMVLPVIGKRPYFTDDDVSLLDVARGFYLSPKPLWGEYAKRWFWRKLKGVK